MPTGEEFLDLDRACGGTGASGQSYDTLSVSDGKVPKGKYWLADGGSATLSSIDELKDINVAGLLYSDGEHYLFFPAAGLSAGTSRTDGGSRGRYWSSTRSSSTDAYRFRFDNSKYYPNSNDSRYIGFSVRPVSD